MITDLLQDLTDKQNPVFGNLPKQVMITKQPSLYLYESGSDKVNREQNYGMFYDMCFHTLINILQTPIKVLEIGVSQNGIGSGHAFCEMPYVETFVGIDNKKLSKDFNEKGIFIWGDAYNKQTIEKAEKYGKFHLIIDDAIHEIEKQRYVLSEYSHLLAEPGILICEDIADDEIEEWLPILREEKKLHLIRCPSLVTLSEHKNFTDCYLSTMVVKMNLPGNGHLRSYGEKSPLDISSSYYRCLEKIKDYLIKLPNLTSTDHEFINAYDIMCGNESDTNKIQKARNIVNRWYDKIINLRESTRDKQGEVFFKVKHVSIGIASNEEMTSIINHIRKQMSDEISKGK